MFGPGTWFATVGAFRITAAPGIETVQIACIHQGYELYGSDRCFVESVAAIRKAFPQAEIEVVLPRAGPIVALLEDMVDRIAIEPIWVLRRSSLPRLIMLGAVQLPIALARAVRLGGLERRGDHLQFACDQKSFRADRRRIRSCHI
jgi:hypothetical protein